jgi:uncharacterized protein YjiS (DUF1127 family)
MHTLPLAAVALRGAIGAAFTDARARLVRWMLRCRERSRQRRALSALDARLLRDIGMDLPAARREIDKPFWRD